MAEHQGLSFTDEEVATLLEGSSLLDDVTMVQSLAQSDDWDSLSDLKRLEVKTAIHGLILKEYLRKDTAPRGLLLTIEPHIFLTDIIFRKEWALISWRCTRDLMVLIIKTANRLSEELLGQIQNLEQKLKGLGPYKKKLEEINKEVKEYKDYLLQAKITKLKKDITKFSLEKIYPYTKEDYVPKWKEDNGSESDTLSSDGHSSGSNSGSEYWDPQGGFSPRSRQRVNRQEKTWSSVATVELSNGL